MFLWMRVYGQEVWIYSYRFCLLFSFRTVSLTEEMDTEHSKNDFIVLFESTINCYMSMSVFSVLPLCALYNSILVFVQILYRLRWMFGIFLIPNIILIHVPTVQIVLCLLCSRIKQTVHPKRNYTLCLQKNPSDTTWKNWFVLGFGLAKDQFYSVRNFKDESFMQAKQYELHSDELQ